MAVSESVRQNLTPEINTDKIHVVHHGVSDIYRVDHPSTTDDPFVLHVSLASSRKNPDAILNTARQLDIPFKIAGNGWDKLMSKEPETENVEILGYVSEDELIELYKRAPIFYFPTLHEGFGLPVLEAMAAGCAVVTSDVYAIPEVTGDAAMVLNPTAVNKHVEVIKHLLESTDERQNLAAEAIERSQQFFWKKTARETTEVYRSVLDGSLL
jgi:glycosyltransferase involved in cell wall biosynthesis